FRPRRHRRPRARARAVGRSAPESHDGQRNVPARSGARGVPATVRRAKNARSHALHARDRQAAAQLTMDPLVLIPGIQGRWEYMRPTVEALQRRFRVLTLSLRGSTLEEEVEAVARVLDEANVPRAVVCGVSFGGAVALKFAARHPERTRALVLASTPGPGWHLRPRHELYARRPMIFGPLFLMETPWRLR